MSKYRYALKVFNHEIQEENRCVYCGLPATSTDHFIPKAYAHSLAGIGVITKQKLLKACGECNSVAGARVFDTVGEKKAYIQGRLTEKYAKFLAIPDWTEEEIEQLGRNLQSTVRAMQLKKTILRYRLVW